jgi:putative transposase
VYNIAYHIVWCVKYRKPLLTGRVTKHLEDLLYQIARDNGFTIETIEIMPDHVHLFVRTTPNHLVASMVKVLKGVSARFLFKEFPELKEELWGGHLWNPSYYVGTIGHISEEAVKKYIETQKAGDKNAAPARVH